MAVDLSRFTTGGTHYVSKPPSRLKVGEYCRRADVTVGRHKGHYMLEVDFCSSANIFIRGKFIFRTGRRGYYAPVYSTYFHGEGGASYSQLRLCLKETEQKIRARAAAQRLGLDR